MCGLLHVNGLAPNNFSGPLVDGEDRSIYAGEITTQGFDNLLRVKDKATYTFSGVSGYTEVDIKTTCVFGLGTAPDCTMTGNAPEPASLSPLALGGLALLRRRRN
jgi:MYXO-CTERM domain-containing protein